MERRHIQWDGRTLRLLDQRALPTREVYVTCKSAEDAAQAIREMVVRGAPAIGITAAYGLAMEAAHGGDLDRAARLLREARPTAVNLAWAVDRMVRAGSDPERLRQEAEAIDREDLEMCRAIGRHGAVLLPEQGTVLTHCNAGGLATAGYGTALGVIRAAVEAGKRISVLADETRPYLQGARLTAYELQQDGIEVAVIPDAAAGHLLARGEVQAIVVGADRIAANGDVANKIGTYPLAVLAARHRVPFYVAAPTSTLDLETPSGEAIPIEERPPEEVTTLAGVPIAPPGVAARNPAFDVTPAELVTALVTERGVLRPPYGPALQAVVSAPDSRGPTAP
ncbi:MAG: S-methyl-5-thioribose-1-phosphate isomerase [Deltaproteobacteria bacterium]|nr:MAG: S-methyl-5-thioribose-1-phosphate isomerase [Deltaproteobacteria bacterium]